MVSGANTHETTDRPRRRRFLGMMIGDTFWTGLAAAMTEHFKCGDFTAGLVHGIDRAGALLAQHFPRAPDDRNELPDDIEETD